MNVNEEHPRNDQAPEAPPAEVDLKKRLAFLDMTEADAQRLRAWSPTLADTAADFVETFYRHLLSFDETARFLQDASMVERLKQLQQEHLQSMLDAKWDDEYVERRRQVGRVHADRGVEPQYFLGAYNQYVQHCLAHLASDNAKDPSGIALRLASLFKAIFLDIGLTLDAYFVQSTSDLRHALDMYWAANNELKQFAHFTSHDLKTPLGTVANLCEEVLDEFGDEIPAEARQLIEQAQTTTYRMSSTIDELLSTSIAAEPVDLDDEVSSEEPIREAADRVRPLVEERGIELILPETYPYVLGNGVQLREVFYNLLSNAVKYMDKDQGRLEIRVAAEASSYVFSVIDNGPGIPLEEQSRIFAPFRRLAKHRDQAGSGLGLYFTKQLVEKQGGRIWVESEVGRGTCFYVQMRRNPET
ncbi:MAG: hypothetical protein IH899_06745 [Planctomycetes bacterium]|nr:hypothetical protein [Planctomycetota bacterium]